MKLLFIAIFLFATCSPTRRPTTAAEYFSNQKRVGNDEHGKGYSNDKGARKDKLIISLKKLPARCKFCFAEKCRRHCIESEFHSQKAKEAKLKVEELKALLKSVDKKTKDAIVRFNAQKDEAAAKLKDSIKKIAYHTRKVKEWTATARGQYALDKSLEKLDIAKKNVAAAQKKMTEAKGVNDKAKEKHKAELAAQDEIQKEIKVMEEKIKEHKKRQALATNDVDTAKKTLQAHQKKVVDIKKQIKAIQKDKERLLVKAREHEKKIAHAKKIQDKTSATLKQAKDEHKKRKAVHKNAVHNTVKKKAEAKRLHDISKGDLVQESLRVDEDDSDEEKDSDEFDKILESVSKLKKHNH